MFKSIFKLLLHSKLGRDLAYFDKIVLLIIHTHTHTSEPSPINRWIAFMSEIIRFGTSDCDRRKRLNNVLNQSREQQKTEMEDLWEELEATWQSWMPWDLHGKTSVSPLARERKESDLREKGSERKVRNTKRVFSSGQSLAIYSRQRVEQILCSDTINLSGARKAEIRVLVAAKYLFDSLLQTSESSSS